MSAVLQSLVNQPYKHGFVTDIESEVAPKGLNEDIIRMISGKKKEPEWQNCHHPKIDFQAISYYAAPKIKAKLNSLDEVDPELLRTFEKLGVSLHGAGGRCGRCDF